MRDRSRFILLRVFSLSRGVLLKLPLHLKRYIYHSLAVRREVMFSPSTSRYSTALCVELLPGSSDNPMGLSAYSFPKATRPEMVRWPWNKLQQPAPQGALSAFLQSAGGGEQLTHKASRTQDLARAHKAATTRCAALRCAALHNVVRLCVVHIHATNIHATKNERSRLQGYRNQDCSQRFAPQDSTCAVWDTGEGMGLVWGIGSARMSLSAYAACDPVCGQADATLYLD